MIFQSGIEDGFYLFVLRQEVSDHAAAAVVNFHAGCERLHSTQDQPALEGRQNRPGGFLQKCESVGLLLIRTDDNSAKSVAVTVEELRGRVHDEIGSQRQGLLK